MKCWKPLLLLFAACSGKPENPHLPGGRASIVRDQWGIQHVYGKTDADAVYGLIYSQCADNFPALEEHYIEKLGRRSERDGKDWLYADLYARLLNDSAAVVQAYREAEPWMKKLLQAFADAVNDYLASQDSVRASVLTRFEPWYPLLFPDGSYTGPPAGGLTLTDMRNLYVLDAGGSTAGLHDRAMQKSLLPGGSNGFAVNSAKSASGNAMLFINPHTDFYYRTEAQVSSGEGLNAYGAVTWGQFFVYQGFNRRCAWMHTSSEADASDLYAETVQRDDSVYRYRYEGDWLAVKEKPVVLRYREGSRTVSLPVTIYATHHGPVVGERNGKWLSMRSREQLLPALMQSWLRMKTDGLHAFRQVLNMHTNTSTNTLYADDSGRIAYWHGNFIPVRDTSFDWSLPVDGSTRATEWKGTHTLDELVHFVNPASGWLQNCNSSGFTAAGRPGLNAADFPNYMAPEGENFRSLRAQFLLSQPGKLSAAQVQAIGFDPHLSLFDSLIPPLVHFYETAGNATSAAPLLAMLIDSLKNWDRKADTASVATTLAVEWAYRIMGELPGNGWNLYRQEEMPQLVQQSISGQRQCALLEAAAKSLEQRCGSWKIPWGKINRLQRPARGEAFSDAAQSFAIPYAPGSLGCLPAFETVQDGTRNAYGVFGNSFVALVEFSKPLKAWSSLMGGHAADPRSPHYLNQVPLNQWGRLKEVIFYPDGRP